MLNLTFYERQKNEFLLKCKLKLRKIARLLHRNHNVVVLEINAANHSLAIIQQYQFNVQPK